MSKLDELISQINKDFKENIIKRGIERKRIERIDFSSPTANFMLYGGIPIARLSEFCGDEGSAKTTTALNVVGNYQRKFKRSFIDEFESLDELLKGNSKISVSERREKEALFKMLEDRGPLKALYVDMEGTLDENWARINGVDTDSLLLLKPTTQSCENILDIIINAIDTGGIGLVVLDSIAALVTEAELGKDLTEATYCGAAGPYTRFVNKLVRRVGKFDVTFIGINHYKEVIGSKYHQMKVLGGKAWLYNCSVRILFKKDELVDENGTEIDKSKEAPAGHVVKMYLLKTKICRPDRRISQYTLNYSKGMDAIVDTVTMAIEYGLIDKAGSWFEITHGVEEPIKKQGKGSIVQFVRENTNVFDALYDEVNRLVKLDDNAVDYENEYEEES